MTARAANVPHLRPQRHTQLPSRPGQPPEAPGQPRRLSRLLWLTLVVITVLGFGLMASRSAAPPNAGHPRGDVAAAQQTIDRLLAPSKDHDPLATLPEDFTRVSGVPTGRVIEPDGTIRGVHVNGGCSAPWGVDNTRWDYSTGCQAHDLGYDLLRYAESKGQPLSPDIRQRLDQRLSTDMHGRCETSPRDAGRACHAVASVYTAGMVLNSWHQRWGPPTGEPIGPWVFGLLVVGLLLAVRLRGWARSRPRAPTLPAAEPSRPHQSCGDRYLATLRMVSIVGLVLGEATLAFATWVGASPGLLWPVTWLCQLAVVFFFAGGHANLHSWRTVRRAGGGYGQYLAGRMGWLMRPVLALILAWLAVPVSLELLGVSGTTTAELAHLTAQPLWLLGSYLLAVAATPLMAWLHRRAALITPLALAAGVVALDPLSSWLGWNGATLPGLFSGFVLALLAQQAGFGYADGTPQRLSRPVLIGTAVAGVAGLTALIGFSSRSWTMLSGAGTPPALGAPALSVLLLGVAQLSVLVLVRRPLSTVMAVPSAWRAITFTRSAPMTLYLGFLAVLVIAIAAVHVPEAPAAAMGGLSWLLEPRQLTALALLAVPALLAFWWGERRDGFGWAFGWSAPAVDSVSARIASVLGVGYGVLGVFGFALAGFAPVPSELTGLAGDPLQNLLHLVLGWFLLYALRTASCERMSTWLLTALACVPQLLTASTAPAEHALTIIVHAGTALLAMTVAIALGVMALRGRAAAPATAR
ncbi:MAG: phospholipase [Pseudonocardiaceae bacterium]|nr:phospholipase [Pseudonocardiaceae bacterium]